MVKITQKAINIIIIIIIIIITIIIITEFVFLPQLPGKQIAFCLALYFEYLSRERRDSSYMYVRLQIKCLLFLSEVN